MSRSSECVCVCVCQHLLQRNSNVHKSRGPGRIHRRMVNEAGDVSEDMEMGRHFHVPALLFRATEGNGSRRTSASVPFLLLTLPYSNGAIPKSRPLATNWKRHFLF